MDPPVRPAAAPAKSPLPSGAPSTPTQLPAGFTCLPRRTLRGVGAVELRLWRSVGDVLWNPNVYTAPPPRHGVSPKLLFLIHPLGDTLLELGTG
jgi:hypothetical protein